MKFRVRETPFWVFASGAAIVAAPAAAFEASDVLSYTAGPITLRPGVAMTERYDDNIFFRQDGPDKKTDFISTLSPNLTFMLGHKTANNPWVDDAGSSPNFLTVGYTLEENIYARNASMNYEDHFVGVESQYITDRIYLLGRDRIQFLNGIVGGYENLGHKASRIAYSDNYTFGYSLTEKTSAYVSGSYNAVTYESGTPLLNVNVWRGTLGFSWKALPKTSFFGETFYGQTAQSPNISTVQKGPHLTSLGGYLGMTRTIATKFKGTIKVGFEDRQFANSSDSSINPVVEGSVNYRFSDKTTTELRYARSSNVSVQAVSVAYTSDTISLNVNQVLTPSGKLRLMAGGSYMMATYDNSAYYVNRTDAWLTPHVSLTYYLRAWMTTSLGYDYEKFSINNSQQYANIIDYNASRVTLRLAIGY